MSDSKLGYEIDGVAVWFHPLRFARLASLYSAQASNLQKRLEQQELKSGGRMDAARSRKLFKAEVKKDDRLRVAASFKRVALLIPITKFHTNSGGIIYDMSRIVPLLEATWLDGITLDLIGLIGSSVYVHFGSTLEYDRDNPAKLIEGVYLSRADMTFGYGWRMTFVCNYPDWQHAEAHTRSQTEKNFARFITFEIPDGFDIASGDYKDIAVEGDPELIGGVSLWHLVRLASNALLYLNQSDPDVVGHMSSLRSEISAMARGKVFQCGFKTVDWNTDWSNARLKPGRWQIVDPGGDGKPMTVEWLRPIPTNVQASGQVIEFKAGVRVKHESNSR